MVPRSLRTTSYPSSELVLADYDDMPQGKLQEHRDYKKEEKKVHIASFPRRNTTVILSSEHFIKPSQKRLVQ